MVQTSYLDVCLCVDEALVAGLVLLVAVLQQQVSA